MAREKDVRNSLRTNLFIFAAFGSTSVTVDLQIYDKHIPQFSEHAT